MKRKPNKAFTLIELIVVIAIIAILVLLALPKFNSYQEKARITKIVNNIKVIGDAAERYYIDEMKWPKSTKVSYTAEQIKSFADEIINVTGQQTDLDADGTFYPIDYSELNLHVKAPDDKVHYILQNPVGEVYYLNKLTSLGKDALESGVEVQPTDPTDPTTPTDPTDPTTPTDPMDPTTPTIVKTFKTEVTPGRMGGIEKIIETKDKGVVIVGNIRQADYTDGYIAKYNSDGQQEWFTYYGEDAHGEKFNSVVEATDGYIAVGITIPNGNGTSDGVIVKFDKNGNQVWSKDYGLTGDKGDRFFDIVKATDGSYVVAGETDGAWGGRTHKGQSDGILMKIDESGNYSWVKSHRTGWTTTDVFNSLSLTSDGGFITTGYFISSSYTKPIVVKFDANGFDQWTYTLNGDDTDTYNSAIELDNGDFIAIARSTVSDGYTNKGSVDTVITRFKSDGTKISTTSFSGTKFDELYEVVKTNDGGFVMIGTSSSSDAGFSNTSNLSNVVIMKYAANGTREWIRNFGENSSYFVGHVITQTSDGGYAIGMSKNATYGIYEKTYIVKLDANGNIE